MANLIISDDGSVRGSFVNLVITICLLGMFVYGILFNPEVVARLKILGTELVGFFTASFGIWAAKSVLESKKKE
jgi:hypothetical protein